MTACFGASGSATVAASVMISMPKPGSMVSILSQSSRVMRLASRSGRPVPTRTRLGAVVDAMADEIEPARAEALQLQRVAELGGELADVAGDGLRRADRLGEGAADLDQPSGRIGSIGSAMPADGLVEAAAELGAEAQRQRRARLRQQLADAVEAEHAETIDQLGRKPQRRDRQAADIGRGASRLGDVARPGAEARQGVGRAPGVGDGGAGAKADAGELVDQGRKHGGLAAMQMIGAGGVDDDPVGRIGRDDRREALQHPERQPLQRLGVGGGIGVLDDKPCTSAWALVAGMPTRRPAAWAAASAASTTRRLPSRPTRMSGASGGGAASPVFRLTRSVDKVGRKTEMTRVIARLQFKIRALAGAATDQFDQPARPADARNGERCGGQRRDAPARGGGRRLAEIGRLGLPAPAAERDADRARSFGGELKPPRGGHRQARDFGHHGAQPAVAQPLLKAGEDGLLVAALEIDDAVGLQAGLGERRREQVRAGDAPEHLAAGARGDPGGEQRGGRAVDRAVSAAGDLMQRAAREAAAWKSRVHCGEPEGQHRCGAPVPAFDLPDLDAQRLEGGRGPHSVWCPPGAR